MNNNGVPQTAKGVGLKITAGSTTAIMLIWMLYKFR